MSPGLSSIGVGSKAWVAESVLRVRADGSGRLFPAKLAIVVHYLPHQLLDHLLADDTILPACQFCDRLRNRVDHVICFTGIDFVDPAAAGYSAKKSSISSTIRQWRQGRS